MNKNILAENMRRFGTKNLNEQTTPLVADIERATTDPELMTAIADWVAQYDSVEELQYDMKMMSKTNAAASQKIADFFQRNQNNAQIRNKQIRQATRRYRASQIDSDKVAQGVGMVGTVGGILLLTFGRIGDVLLKSLGIEGGNFYSKE